MTLEHLPLHTIRLAGPWEFQVGIGTAAWRTIKVPVVWKVIAAALGMEGEDSHRPTHFRGAQGGLTARRRFQRPTGLDQGERVWIVVPDARRESIKIQINDSSIAAAEGEHPIGAAFDVTESLRARNIVTIEFDIDRLMADDEATSSVFQGALIEIRAAAHANS